MKSKSFLDSFFEQLARPANALMNRSGLAFLLGILSAHFIFTILFTQTVPSSSLINSLAAFVTLSVDFISLIKIMIIAGGVTFWYFFLTATPMVKLNSDWVNSIAVLALLALATLSGLLFNNWLPLGIMLLWGCCLGVYKLSKGEGLSLGLGTDLGRAKFDDSLNALSEQNMLAEEGFIVGRPLGSNNTDQFIRFEGEGHLVTFASTAAGKGVGIVIPNLQTYKGSIVVLDIKGENFLNSISEQDILGKEAYLVDPFFEVHAQLKRKIGKLKKAVKTDIANQNELNKALEYYKALLAKVRENGKYAFGINPLSLIIELYQAKEFDAIFDEASVLANTIVIKSPDEKDPHWNEKSIALLKCGILLLMFADSYEDMPRNLVSVKNIILDIVQNDKIKQEVIRLCQEADYEFHCYLKDIPAELNLMGNEERSSVLSNFLRHTSFISSPYAAQSLSGRSVDLGKLKTEFKTVYLVLPAGKLEAYSRLMRLWIATLMQAMIKDQEHPSRRVLFLLDEVAQLGNLPILSQAVSLMRGYGLNLWMIFQDIPQLKATYGEKWQTFIANSKIQQFFAVNDNETADYVSKQLGSTTVTTEGYTASPHDEQRGIFAPVNKTYGSAARALMLSEEVRLYADQIIFHQGNYPFRAKKIRFYDDPYFIKNFKRPFSLPPEYYKV